MRRMLAAGLLCVVSLCLFPESTMAALKVEEVPTFQVRARVVSVAGKEPAAGMRFSFHLGHSPAESVGGGWSNWMKFDRGQVEAEALARLRK